MVAGRQREGKGLGKETLPGQLPVTYFLHLDSPISFHCLPVEHGHVGDPGFMWDWRTVHTRTVAITQPCPAACAPCHAPWCPVPCWPSICAYWYSQGLQGHRPKTPSLLVKDLEFTSWSSDKGPWVLPSGVRGLQSSGCVAPGRVTAGHCHRGVRLNSWAWKSVGGLGGPTEALARLPPSEPQLVLRDRYSLFSRSHSRWGL